MNERTAMDQLQSLLGVWLTDSPTWPPAPGIKKALRLLQQVDREHMESLAVYIGQIKDTTRELMAAQRELDEALAEQGTRSGSGSSPAETAPAVPPTVPRSASAMLCGICGRVPPDDIPWCRETCHPLAESELLATLLDAKGALLEARGVIVKEDVRSGGCCDFLLYRVDAALTRLARSVRLEGANQSSKSRSVGG